MDDGGWKRWRSSKSPGAPLPRRFYPRELNQCVAAPTTKTAPGGQRKLRPGRPGAAGRLVTGDATPARKPFRRPFQFFAPRTSGYGFQSIHGDSVHQTQALFRQEAIDAQTASPLGAVRLATPVSHQVWTLAALAIAGAIVAWLFLGSYTRRERVAGTLVPQAGLLTVTAHTAGTVSALHVAEGNMVHAGEALLTIADERNSATMGDTSAVISTQLRQQQTRLHSDIDDTQTLASEQAADLRMQQHMLQNQIAQVDGQLAIEQRQVDDLSGLLHRLQALGTQGYVSALDIQQQRTQELDAEGQVKSLARQHSESEQQLKSVGDQLAQLPLATSAKVNDLHRQIDQDEQSLAQNEADRAMVLRAPEAGVVSSVLVKSGQAVTAGQALLAVFPVYI